MRDVSPNLKLRAGVVRYMCIYTFYHTPGIFSALEIEYGRIWGLLKSENYN
jgi:hypothetical protein